MSNDSSNRSPTVRVGGIVLDGADNLLIVFGKNSKKWSVPKGSLEGDETFLEGALREIKEETGIRLQPNSTNNMHYWAVSRARLYLFRLSDIRPALKPNDTYEVDKAMWLNLDNSEEVGKVQLNANKMLSAVIGKLKISLERENSSDF